MMIRFQKFLCTSGIVLSGIMFSSEQGFSQANLPLATTGEQVVIKREATRVIDPHKYRVPLAVEANQTVTLVAPFDGLVKQLAAKTNSRVQAQGEVVRLDNSVQKLRLAHAQAMLKKAIAEQKAAGKEEITAELAQAGVDIAKIDVELAQSLLDLATIRAPFAGEVQRVLVTEGQFLRAGDPVAIVADSSKVKVEIPVERAQAENGKSFPLKIEGVEVQGKIDQVLPLPARFDVLRELFDSIASVQVVVDNNGEKIKAGQTVFVPLIPRQPVTEVPVTAVGNLPDGNRKIQVVRQYVVRDIPVTVLAQVGGSRVFVSGPFAEGDEVIYESSHQLGDGFQLKPSSGTSVAGGAAPEKGPASPTTVNPTNTNPKAPPF
ncbi:MULTISPECIES: efflux RND transporter periplasmic adaptor subunit [unclassified Schlesneria]|uniref:efflux RND transporter periplasmic adaptor subunit n=1 Tax=unclassified Schlesneria TaxID=2762017 RepID=UPI002F06280C